MRARPICAAALAALLAAGCGTTKVVRVDDPEAVRQMRIADSLESTTALPEAAQAYAAVAEQYPEASFHHTAVRKTAFLHTNPLNPAADDSVALRWLEVYDGLQITKEEHESAVVAMLLLKRIIAFRAQIDELAVSAKKQAAEVAARSNRVHDLETQLKEASDELQKMRDIDLKVSKRGSKK